MKLFNCTTCGQVVHFDSQRCVRCGAALGLAPESLTLVAVAPDGSAWVDGRSWSLCAHRLQGCNWLVAAGDGTAFCVSCRLNQIIPDLSVPGHLPLWQRLEKEKRRLIYAILRLQLPLLPKTQTPGGLAFAFLADPAPGSKAGHRVLTAHDNGTITINLAEADPVARERARAQLNEPYRTLLGHFRHESGHYYWERLIRDTSWLTPFRERFGDERADYAQALRAHYQAGPPGPWWEQHVSAYAATHPWEDWAESWSHYLQMVDTLETAWIYGLAMAPRLPGGEALVAQPTFDPYGPADFPGLIREWLPLTVALNSLNQSLGHEAAYPFALAAPVIEKLALVHRVIRECPPAG